jgi:ribosomal protein L12E/L44/L45/RPP1/RPP2
MKYLSAYCMVALSGSEVSEASVKKVLESVGCEVDSHALERVFSAMKGKALHEVIASGMTKLAVMGGVSSAPQ